MPDQSTDKAEKTAVQRYSTQFHTIPYNNKLNSVGRAPRAPHLSRTLLAGFCHVSQRRFDKAALGLKTLKLRIWDEKSCCLAAAPPNRAPPASKKGSDKAMITQTLPKMAFLTPFFTFNTWW
eukprot:scaffold13154_cov163-Ochromonas_danica.AAC.1